jgi:hypothetical protein
LCFLCFYVITAILIPSSSSRPCSSFLELVLKELSGINISLLRNQLEIEDRLTSVLVLRASNSSESSSRPRASYSRTCRYSKSHSLLYTAVWQLVKSQKKKKKKQDLILHTLYFLLPTYLYVFRFLGFILTFFSFLISFSENEKKDFLCLFFVFSLAQVP